MCSVTNPECYNGILVEKGLKNIGVPYDLILTDPELSLSESYNSIIKTHRDIVVNSKFIVFLSQDAYFEMNDWGKALLCFCSKLKNFGYGGGECIKTNGCGIGFGTEHNNLYPCEVSVCDANMIIIPSYLFLKRQFDTRFKWYPFAEDYALWVNRVRRLSVYYIPIRCHSGGCATPSRWVNQFKDAYEYAKALRVDHNRLLKKWRTTRIKTTTWG